MRRMILELDDLDYKAIQEAIARRLTFGQSLGITDGCLPDGNSNQEGAVLAEICRGWSEFMGLSFAKAKQGA